MNLLKYTPYAYLIVAILLAVESFNQFKAGSTGNCVIMGVLSLLAVFMFFFRRNYAKKFAERYKKP
jgi:positive regulator of sigma E activity